MYKTQIQKLSFLKLIISSADDVEAICFLALQAPQKNASNDVLYVDSSLDAKIPMSAISSILCHALRTEIRCAGS